MATSARHESTRVSRRPSSARATPGANEARQREPGLADDEVGRVRAAKERARAVALVDEHWDFAGRYAESDAPPPRVVLGWLREAIERGKREGGDE